MLDVSVVLFSMPNAMCLRLCFKIKPICNFYKDAIGYTFGLILKQSGDMIEHKNKSRNVDVAELYSGYLYSSLRKMA